nr:MAG TPA: hypothetical protein [Herelleviridae sp.]
MTVFISSLAHSQAKQTVSCFSTLACSHHKQAED